MKFIIGLVDKLIFGVLLLFSLQVPQFIDQLQQYLTGYRDALADQVAAYEEIASTYGFENLQAMITDHSHNLAPSVRADARLKWLTLEQLQELDESLIVFKEGPLWRQLGYLLQPNHSDEIAATLEQFSPGLPLHVSGFLLGGIIALVCYGILYGVLGGTYWLVKTARSSLVATARKRQPPGV